MKSGASAVNRRALDSQITHVGRPRALPPEALRRVLTLRAAGLGYRAIASTLRGAGIDVDWSTVRRAVKGWPPYVVRRSTKTRAGDSNPEPSD